jgi:hypothetical protein
MRSSPEWIDVAVSTTRASKDTSQEPNNQPTSAAAMMTPWTTLALIL